MELILPEDGFVHVLCYDEILRLHPQLPGSSAGRPTELHVEERVRVTATTNTGKLRRRKGKR